MGYNCAMKKVFSPHLELAHKLWEELLSPEDLAIDATVGNGFDTAHLAALCKTIGLDIQQEALDRAAQKLKEAGLQGDLRRMCHSKIDELSLAGRPKLIVYNLGYLPRGNKGITTMLESTSVSLQKALALLGNGGALSIMCYPGHEEGKREAGWIEAWVQTLAGKWRVDRYAWEAKTPYLFWISSIM
jgi:methylase of polypeptide subunit release factors